MRARCFASKALLLAIATLLLAVGPAAAGSYSPKHLRAESFLKLQTLNDGYEPGLRRSTRPLNDLQLRLGFQYPLNIGPGAMVMRVGARTKLSQLVRFEVLF